MDMQRSQREWASSSPDPISASRLTPCPWFLRDFPVSFQLSAFFLGLFFHVLVFHYVHPEHLPQGRWFTVTEGSLVILFGFFFSRYSKEKTWESPSTFHGQRSPGDWPVLKVSQEGRQSLTQTQRRLYHASLIFKVPPEKGTLAPSIIKGDVQHS